MYLAYSDNVGVSKLIKKHSSKDCDVMYLDDLMTLIGNVTQKHRALKFCMEFRNTYVHKGPLYAKDGIDRLLTVKDDIEVLAEYAGISQLNWNKKLCVLNSN